MDFVKIVMFLLLFSHWGEGDYQYFSYALHLLAADLNATSDCIVFCSLLFLSEAVLSALHQVIIRGLHDALALRRCISFVFVVNECSWSVPSLLLGMIALHR